MLWAQNGPWPGYADPSDELGSWEVIVLHGVASDERASSSQTGLAVHCQCSLCTLGIVQEALDDFEGGHAAIGEVEFLVVDIILDEVVGVVGFVI